jgi:hypothetical protein
MIGGKRTIAALLVLGLAGFAPAAMAEGQESLDRQLNRLMNNTAKDLKERANEMSRILRQQLETMMDESGNMVIEGPWPWQKKLQPEEPNFSRPEEPFGGIEA